MAKVHFDKAVIEIGYFSDLWGPYGFKFPIATSATANDGLIPFGDTIFSVSVKTYKGSANRGSDLSNFTEIEDLIDPDYTIEITDGHTVWIKFQNPGSDYYGEKATLVFEVTLASGGKADFYFQHVAVK